ncbi:uncharacterized protein LOC116342165 [Contarinia nasturtii]|uniref:uncharacterized protein LOC116342165 n=1 Tax=Contarinia nasturtii TaxID=265458 RepID=UPI0012D3D2E4|nr:uncharacterized protein LOC116342165 [Contarinia nasturtii]
MCIGFLVIVNGQDQYKVVTTKSGPVKGQLEKTVWLEKPFYSFKGIPYAKPPVGELRFKPPEPVEAWSSPLDAFEYGNRCAQKFLIFSATSENCLFLNIFVPALINEKENLPVIFIIHGGLFAVGSGEDRFYGPDFANEHDIILVTVNYRLGIFGFLSLGTPEYSGNMALKDQQMAMKWIHENIEAFGGDKKRITMFGVSSGAQSHGFHLLNAESSKYFNQQITISGTSNNIKSFKTGDHRCLMEIFYAKHNSGKPNTKNLIDFLQKAEVEDILNFNKQAINGFISPWTPIVEKKNAKKPFFTEDPMKTFQKTKSISKATLFGSAQYEHLYFIRGSNYSKPQVIDAFLKDFHIGLPIFGYYTTIWKKPNYLEGVLHEIKEYYFGKATNDHERVIQRLILDSDITYSYFQEKWMEQHVAISKKDTFYTRFSVSTKINPHEIKAAAHADELCYLFRCNKLIDYYKQIKANNKHDPDSSEILQVMNNMQSLYYNFVKYGTPIHDGKPIREFKPVQQSS